MGTQRIGHTEHRVPGAGTWRPGAVSHEESDTDLVGYLQPLEQVHAGALHGQGVAEGLTVTAVAGTATVRIAPGVAVDPLGRHVVVAPGGQVEVSAKPDVTSRLVTVMDDGVDLSTIGLTGVCEFSVQWRETFDRQLLDDSFQQTFVTRHTPWLRLLQAGAGADDPLRVVLATVTLDAASGVVPGGLTSAGRRGVTPGSEEVLLRRPRLTSTGSGMTLAEAPAGRLTARLQAVRLEAAAAGAGLELGSDGGTLGMLSLEADTVVLRRADGSTPVLMDAAAGRIGIGTTTPSHALQVSANRGLRQNELYLSGGRGWSSLSCNAFHNDTNDDWVFPDRSRPAATIDFGDRAGAHRLAVLTTSSADTAIWRLRLSLDGDTGFVEVPGAVRCGTLSITDLEASGDVTVSGLHTAGGGARLNGVTLGCVGLAAADPARMRYPNPYETVGVSRPEFNLRLQSPNSIILHTYDTPTAAYRSRMSVGGDGTFAHVTIGPGENGRLWTRHIDGKQWNQDTNDGLYLNYGTGQAVHVGGAAPADLEVSGAVRAQGGMTLAAGTTLTGLGRLHVSGAELLYLLNAGGVIVSSSWGGSGSLRVQGLSPAGWPEDLPFPSWSGGGIGAWDIFARGALYVGTDPSNPKCQFYSDGTKRFVIDHPLDPDRRNLTHACIEGPEAGVYYRGEGQLADGSTWIGLPDYFEALTRPEGRSVLLTPLWVENEEVVALAASSVADGGFMVRALDGRNPGQRFYWEVKAVRSDVERLVVETAKRRLRVGGDTHDDHAADRGPAATSR